MSMSLRDQLLQAGLITKKQAQQAGRPQQKPKQQQADPKLVEPSLAEAARLAAEAARAEKQAQDQARNKALQEKAEQKARRAQVKQLVDQHRIAKVETEETYNFTDGTNVRRLPVTADLRKQLIEGRIGIVRCDGRYEFVPAAIAEKIGERDPRALILLNKVNPTNPNGPAEDDPYKDYVVPDDLVW